MNRILLIAISFALAASLASLTTANAQEPPVADSPPTVAIGPDAIETLDAHGQPCCKAPSWTPQNYCNPCYRGRIFQRVVYRFRYRARRCY